MDTETTMAQGLYGADTNARYDAACKRVLSEKFILAWIMKSCLEEYRDCNVRESVWTRPNARRTPSTATA